MENQVTDTTTVSQNKTSVSNHLIKKNLEITDRFFFEALRRTKYDIYSAIYELQDNSIDAGATLIELIFDKENKTLIIKDNGCGMSLKRLMNCMDLGCDNTYTQTQIGYFGVGLKAGLLNLIDINEDNPTIEILTNDGNETTKMFWEPKKDVRELNFKILNDTSVQRGTIVTINGVTIFNPSPFKRNAGTVFYPTLKNGHIKMMFNNEEIIGYDPLYRDREKTLSNFVDANVCGESIRIHSVVIDDLEDRTPWDDKVTNKDGWSFHKYGCYVIYGGRYIEIGGTSLGVRPFDAWFSRTRIEFAIPKVLTELFEVPFNKTSGIKIQKEKMPDMWTKIWDQLSWGNVIRGKSVKNKPLSVDEEKENEELVKQLNKSAINAGINPPKTQESGKKEVSFKANPNKETKEKVEKSNRARIIEKKVYDVKFENLGNTGVFWRLTYENNKFTIYINTTHVFFKQVYSQLDKSAKYGIMNLLASMAFTQYRTAELGSDINDEYFWDTYWGDVSLQLMKIMNN